MTALVNATASEKASGLYAQNVESFFKFGDGLFKAGMLVEFCAERLEEVAGFSHVLGCVRTSIGRLV